MYLQASLIPKFSWVISWTPDKKREDQKGRGKGREKGERKVALWLPGGWTPLMSWDL